MSTSIELDARSYMPPPVPDQKAPATRARWWDGPIPDGLRQVELDDIERSCVVNGVTVEVGRIPIGTREVPIDDRGGTRSVPEYRVRTTTVEWSAATDRQRQQALAQRLASWQADQDRRQAFDLAARQQSLAAATCEMCGSVAEGPGRGVAAFTLGGHEAGRVCGACRMRAGYLYAEAMASADRDAALRSWLGLDPTSS